MDRVILHVDMDAFFAAVEQRDDPRLRGKPVLVGGRGRRGVVSTASYEARVFGCRSAMPMGMALQLCPHAIVVGGQHSRYSEVSDQVFEILERFSPQIQTVSVDEAFLDVTASQQLFGDGPTIAQMIRSAIKKELELTASVGIAFNKFLAKLGSDLNKPDGVTIITHENLRATLDPQPVGRVWGIGPKAAAKLARINVKTIGDLLAQDDAFYARHFGISHVLVRELISGIDDRPVHSDHSAKSIGQEQTFGENIYDTVVLKEILLGQVEQVSTRLRRAKLLAGAVQLKLRYGDFKTLTRRATLDHPTDQTATLWHAARTIFDAWADDSLAPLRLLGFSASGLQIESQLDLFDQKANEKSKRLDATLDSINERFGKLTVHRSAARKRADDPTRR
ncbi:MAG TPA: DNA polymerase IV, partial [Tepidisphaeraceae bacterium]|nr:DNA polymerase IV [Tepidisphaeraceae bacterium]